VPISFDIVPFIEVVEDGLVRQRIFHEIISEILNRDEIGNSSHKRYDSHYLSTKQKELKVQVSPTYMMIMVFAA